MQLIGGDILVLDADFFQTADGNKSFPHPVLHAFDEGRHAHEAGNTKDNPEHRQQRTELMRQNLLKPNNDGIEEIHATLFSSRLAIRPSRISMRRGVSAAISGSCVTSAM